MRHFLGIDYGTVRVGLALADSESRLARPFRTLDARRGLMPALRGIVEEEAVELVILGRPTRSQGEPGSLDHRITHFADVIRSWGLDVIYQEEAYTSERAQRLLADRREQGLGGAPGGVDAVAAMLILQDWLSSRAEHPDE